MFVPMEIAHNLAMLLPPVRAFARRWGDSTGLMNDASNARQVFDEFSQYRSPVGKDVVELGPGQSPHVLRYALDAGAKSAAGLDVVDHFKGQPPPGIRIHVYDGKRMPFNDASVDLIWSHACLEHVRYPEWTIKECARALRSGGMMVCSIDLKDHYHEAPEEAADHLRYSEWLWNAMKWNRSAYTNRLRASDWSNLFQGCGFSVRLLRPEISEALRSVYRAKPIRGYSEADFVTTEVYAVLDRP